MIARITEGQGTCGDPQGHRGKQVACESIFAAFPRPTLWKPTYFETNESFSFALKLLQVKENQRSRAGPNLNGQKVHPLPWCRGTFQATGSLKPLFWDSPGTRRDIPHAVRQYTPRLDDSDCWKVLLCSQPKPVSLKWTMASPTQWTWVWANFGRF